jgi:two-component system, chemotaxis family, CheB/CheR fusion protein
MEPKQPGPAIEGSSTPSTGPGGGDDPVAPADVSSPAVQEPAPFPIVGIGASAGGLEALEVLTKRLSPTGMAFVVLQHLAPGHDSALADILSRDTALKVVTLVDGTPAEINHIYVAPPGVDVTVHQGTLCLAPPPAVRRGSRLSIDAFFGSLAADRGASAIGVILSGAGTDGTLGLSAIKERGGITFVQEPTTARQSSMPQSALDSGCADFCLSPAEIGDELTQLSTHPYVFPKRVPRAFDPHLRGRLFVLLRSAFGVDFSAYKTPTLERRIQRRMALHRLTRLEEYLEVVQANAGELSLLYGDLLINVTAFFRDPEAYEALRSLVWPQLVDGRDPDVPIRIWVAGCASGEEAYSIGICLLEHLGDRASGFRVQIFATDIDERALSQARSAVYPQSIELDVSPERLKRFFTRSDKGGYRVCLAVRDLVVFARHNLGKNPPLPHMDLVSCRNVLIYMQPALQKKVLRTLHYALKANAFLLLGASDSVGDGSDLFSLLDRKAKLYSKKEITRAATGDFSFDARVEAAAPRVRAQDHRPALTVLQLADRRVLEQYSPPGVVVNETFDILQYRGKTGRFFEPTPGVVTVNLLKLARPELVPELRAALHRALAENARVRSGPSHVRHDDQPLVVTMDVTPLPDPGTNGKAFIVMFIERRDDGEPPQGPAPAQGPTSDAWLEELERELASTKELLRTRVEEFEVASEELQSSNEELQSTNEELQSTNEELVTLNEELHNRMAQLEATGDDLQNVLATTSAALILVGLDLRIRSFSAAAEKLLNLIPGDVGRPIAYIRTVMVARDLEQTVANAASSLATVEQKVRSADGHWHTMRITPYRTADHVVRGAVIELTRAFAGEGHQQSRELRTRDRAILAALPQALALLDEAMCVTWGNRAFLELFQVDLDSFGRPLEDLWAGKTEHPDVWKLLEDAAIGGRAFRRVSTTAPSFSAGRCLTFSALRLTRDSGQPPHTLVIVEAGMAEGEGRIDELS